MRRPNRRHFLDAPLRLRRTRAPHHKKIASGLTKSRCCFDGSAVLACTNPKSTRNPGARGRSSPCSHASMLRVGPVPLRALAPRTLLAFLTGSSKGRLRKQISSTHALSGLEAPGGAGGEHTSTIWTRPFDPLRGCKANTGGKTLRKGLSGEAFVKRRLTGNEPFAKLLL